jgi:uncharacterized protein
MKRMVSLIVLGLSVLPSLRAMEGDIASFQSLPNELKLLILQNIGSSKDFFEAIKELKNLSLVHPEWVHLVNNIIKTIVEQHKAKGTQEFDADFMKAVKSGALSVVNAMLDYDLDLPRQDKINFLNNTLDAAIRSEKANTGVAARLIDAGADITRNTLNNPLAVAAKRNKPEMVKLLIEKGADVNLPIGIGGETPATFITSVAVLEPFVESGADLSEAKFNGKNLLMLAIEENNMPLFSRLLELKAGLNDRDYNGETALMKAVNLANTEAVRKLLEAGADSNIMTEGKTALDMAVKRNLKAIADMLWHSAGK